MPKIIIVHYEEDPEAIIQLRLDTRYLWGGHVNYIARAIASILADVPALSAIADRLTTNSEELGQWFAPYYGVDCASACTDLIKEHVQIGIDSVMAIKAKASTTALEAKNLANATAFADCLASYDSVNWAKSIILPLLTDHNECTVAQAAARASGDWSADLVAYDACCLGIVKLADVLSTGVVDSFPNKFVHYEEFTAPNRVPNIVYNTNVNSILFKKK